jgi:hypothetical protein
MKTLGFQRFGFISPSQVRYRAALRPDLPKRLDPVMISGFEAQELISENENKIGKIVIGGNFRCRDSHANRHGCSKLVPPKETTNGND